MRKGRVGMGVLVAVFAAGAMPSTSAAAPCLRDTSLVERSVTVGSQTRSYWLALPSNPPAGPRPLLVALHGLGSSGCAHAGHTQWSTYSNTSGRKFITVFPNASGASFKLTENSDDVAFIRALVAQEQAQRSIDPNRIHASGHSNGAYFAQRLACDAEDVFGSVTEYAGGTPVTQVSPGCSLSRGVAIGMFHGGNDTVVPISAGRTSRDEWAARESCSTRNPATGEPNRVTFSNCAIGGGVRIEWTVLPGQNHTWPSGASNDTMRASMWAHYDEFPKP